MKKRILICTFSMGIGGMENFLKNIVENIDKNRFELVFAINSQPKNLNNIEILEKNSVKIIYVGNMRPNFFRYIKNIKNIFEVEGPFDVVHTNLEYQGSIVLGIAKKYGVKKRIAHSHTTNVTTGYNQLLMPLYRYLFKHNANYFLACGIKAGNYMFGKKNNFEVIKNGIDVSKFLKNNIRRESQLKIGQIGRLSKEKNQKFSIDLLMQLHKNGYRYNLYFIGDGPDKAELIKQSIDYELSEYVHFLGMKSDMENWYCQFDFLILPSLYEGVPFALLEAQSSGVFTFASNNIAEESDLGLKLIEFLPLELSKWVDKIRDFHITYLENTKIEDTIKSKGYCLYDIVAKLEDIYEK